MGRRIFLFTLAMFLNLVAEGFWVGHAGRAADECMTKPGAAAPQGSHWYYRLDRTNHRQCWYLAAESTKVRPHARQAGSPVRSQGAQPVAHSEASDAATFAGTPAQTIPAQAASVEMTVGQGGAAENDPASASSKQWSFLSVSPVSNASDAVATNHGFEHNQSDATSSPVVAAAEPRAVEPPEEPAAPPSSALLIGVMGVAAMIVAVAFAVYILRKRSHSNTRHRSPVGSSPARRGKQAVANAARVAESAGQTQVPRNKVQVPRPPSSRVGDIELSVRQLLRELQRRQHEVVDHAT